MSNPDPGAATDGVPLAATWFNTVRTGVLNALDIAGGSRTITSKLTLLGAAIFELGDQLLYSSQSQTRWDNMVFGEYDAARFTIDNLEGAAITTSTSQGYFYFKLNDLPHGNVLTSVSVYFTGPPTNAAEPAQLPRLEVYKRALTTGTATQIGSTTTDTYGSSAAYKAKHLITVGSLSETIDRTANVYYGYFRSESGANAAIDARVEHVGVVATITKQPVGF